MTLKEKSSNRKMLALKRLTENGEYSAEYSLQLCEDYHDNGKLIDTDYNELAEFLEDLLNKEEVSENNFENTIDNMY